MAESFTLTGSLKLDPRSINQSARQVKQALGRITGQASEFQKSLDASTARVFAFGATTIVLNSVSQAFQNLVRSTIEVEARLTEINAIFQQSESVMNRFRETIFSVAQETGQTFNTVADAAAELARQGLSAEETAQRLQAALILTRISGLGAEDSVKTLTAAINGFTSAALTAEEVTSKIVAVDTAFAVSAQDLAQGLARAGSTAEDAGVSFDQLLGLITAVEQRTARGGAVIGNAFKSIFTRLSRGSTISELQELGVQIDSTQTGVQKLQALSNALEKIADPTVASKIKELAGGVFQINVVSATLKDLANQTGVFKKATDEAAQASDNAFKRNAELNKSLSAQINSLTVGLTNLAEKIGGVTFGPLLDNLVSIANKITDVFNKALDPEKGNVIIKGFIKGIGAFLSGPGLVIITTAFLKIVKLVGKFAIDGFKALQQIGSAAEKIKQVEGGIVGLLSQDEKLRRAIGSTTLSQAQKEQAIINAIKRENALLSDQRQILQSITALAVKRGFTGYTPSGGFKRTGKAAGYIPNFAVKDEYALEEAQARVLGATKSVRAKEGKGTIGGKRFIMNDQETEIPNFGKNGDSAVIPNYSRGHIPNFAAKAAGSGRGIYDSDFLLGKEKAETLNYILSTEKKKNLLIAPAGAGKTTAAKKRGGKFITGKKQAEKFSEYLILSASGRAKKNIFSPQLAKITDSVKKSRGKIEYLYVPNEEIGARRNKRINKGSLDPRDRKALIRTKKAPKNQFDFLAAIKKIGGRVVRAAEGYIPNYASPQKASLIGSKRTTVGSLSDKYVTARNSADRANKKFKEGKATKINKNKKAVQLKAPENKNQKLIQKADKITSPNIDVFTLGSDFKKLIKQKDEGFKQAKNAASDIEKLVNKKYGGSLTDEIAEYKSNSALDVIGKDLAVEVKAGGFNKQKVVEKFQRFPLENATNPREKVGGLFTDFSKKIDDIKYRSTTKARLITGDKATTARIAKEVKDGTLKRKPSLAMGYIPNFAGFNQPVSDGFVDRKLDSELFTPKDDAPFYPYKTKKLFDSRSNPKLQSRLEKWKQKVNQEVVDVGKVAGGKLPTILTPTGSSGLLSTERKGSKDLKQLKFNFPIKPVDKKQQKKVSENFEKKFDSKKIEKTAVDSAVKQANVITAALGKPTQTVSDINKEKISGFVGAVRAGAGSIFDAAITTALQLKAGKKGEGADFDVRNNGGNLKGLTSIFGSKPTPSKGLFLGLGDFKFSQDAQDSMKAKTLKEISVNYPNVFEEFQKENPKRQPLKRQQKKKTIKKTSKAAGYIPNFALERDPLSEAIQREKDAGVPSPLIRVEQSKKLVNKKNPEGLAITNKRDEPNGLRDVFANGFIPNYASPKKGLNISKITEGLSSLGGSFAAITLLGIAQEKALEKGTRIREKEIDILSKANQAQKELAIKTAENARKEAKGDSGKIAEIETTLEKAIESLSSSLENQIASVENSTTTLERFTAVASQSLLVLSSLAAFGPQFGALGNTLGKFKGKLTGVLGKTKTGLASNTKTFRNKRFAFTDKGRANRAAKIRQNVPAVREKVRRKDLKVRDKATLARSKVAAQKNQKLLGGKAGEKFSKKAGSWVAKGGKLFGRVAAGAISGPVVLAITAALSGLAIGTAVSSGIRQGEKDEIQDKINKSKLTALKAAKGLAGNIEKENVSASTSVKFSKEIQAAKVEYKRAYKDAAGSVELGGGGFRDGATKFLKENSVTKFLGLDALAPNFEKVDDEGKQAEAKKKLETTLKRIEKRNQLETEIIGLKEEQVKVLGQIAAQRSIIATNTAKESSLQQEIVNAREDALGDLNRAASLLPKGILNAGGSERVSFARENLKVDNARAGLGEAKTRSARADFRLSRLQDQANVGEGGPDITSKIEEAQREQKDAIDGLREANRDYKNAIKDGAVQMQSDLMSLGEKIKSSGDESITKAFQEVEKIQASQLKLSPKEREAGAGKLEAATNKVSDAINALANNQKRENAVASAQTFGGIAGAISEDGGGNIELAIEKYKAGIQALRDPNLSNDKKLEVSKEVSSARDTISGNLGEGTLDIINKQLGQDQTTIKNLQFKVIETWAKTLKGFTKKEQEDIAKSAFGVGEKSEPNKDVDGFAKEQQDLLQTYKDLNGELGKFRDSVKDVKGVDILKEAQLLQEALKDAAAGPKKLSASLAGLASFGKNANVAIQEAQTNIAKIRESSSAAESQIITLNQRFVEIGISINARVTKLEQLLGDK